MGNLFSRKNKKKGNFKSMNDLEEDVKQQEISRYLELAAQVTYANGNNHSNNKLPRLCVNVKQRYPNHSMGDSELPRFSECGKEKHFNYTMGDSELGTNLLSLSKSEHNDNTSRKEEWPPSVSYYEDKRKGRSTKSYCENIESHTTISTKALDGWSTNNLNIESDITSESILPYSEEEQTDRMNTKPDQLSLSSFQSLDQDNSYMAKVNYLFPSGDQENCKLSTCKRGKVCMDLPFNGRLGLIESDNKYIYTALVRITYREKWEKQLQSVKRSLIALGRKNDCVINAGTGIPYLYRGNMVQPMWITGNDISSVYRCRTNLPKLIDNLLITPATIKEEFDCDKGQARLAKDLHQNITVNPTKQKTTDSFKFSYNKNLFISQL